MKPEPILLLSDAVGVYIPRNFTFFFEDSTARVVGADPETWKVLQQGPDHDEYWDAWQEIERDAVVIDAKGNRYRVHQDGDCWLVPEGMGWDHKTEKWVWFDE